MCAENYESEHMKSMDKSKCRNKHVLECEYFSALQRSLCILIAEQHLRYSLSAQGIINNFLHLLEYHDTEQDIQFIRKQQKGCNSKNCKSFQRFCAYRNAHNHEQKNEPQNNQDIEDDVMYQIYDKIHCNYLHSALDEHKMDGFDNRIRVQRYQQLFHDVSRKKAAANFEIGHEFYYGFAAEECKSAIMIDPKYTSLKEELISNNLCRLTAAQFNAEYLKAKLNYNSQYCRKRIHANEYDVYKEDWEFLLQHVLVLQIYCNFTDLQYHFSKTYRQDDEGKDHTNFYFMGLYLKIATQIFGTLVSKGNIKIFYHGMSEQLSFSHYFFGEAPEGMYIVCPLSTTSSFGVAANFAGCNGLIIEIGRVENMFMVDNFSHNKYFSVQNKGNFQIKNIFEVGSGNEYRVLLSALSTLKCLIVNRSLHIELKDETRACLVNIFSNELSKFGSYGQKMIKNFCIQQQSVSIDFYEIKEASLMNLFYDDISTNKYIAMQKIHSLFPQMKRLIVSSIDLTKECLESTVEYLLDHENDTQLECLTIIPMIKHVSDNFTESMIKQLDEIKVSIQIL